MEDTLKILRGPNPWKACAKRVKYLYKIDEKELKCLQKRYFVLEANLRALSLTTLEEARNPDVIKLEDMLVLPISGQRYSVVKDVNTGEEVAGITTGTIESLRLERLHDLAWNLYKGKAPVRGKKGQGLDGGDEFILVLMSDDEFNLVLM
ncbi:hypothetical protein R1sor_012365 [Riccia sorocarpa]|uniref:Uncharacterized protein n=1 Tax=Riccia sorocarpa TaxID=122646 RepID=A0ABD3I5E6_9MARC